MLLSRLRTVLSDIGSGVVAFSAGADSTLLLRVAAEALGPRVLAVTGVSETYPGGEREEAVRLARRFGVGHLLIPTKELSRSEFSRNSPDRCYHCKSELFGRLAEIARERGLRWVLDGSNLDDLADYRPGRRAGEEFGVRSPLREAGLDKAAVRDISRRLGLPTWNKPAMACLSSRFPYGEEITPEKLRRVDRAEAALREMGFAECRVRYHGPVARIEVPAGRIAELAAEGTRERLAEAVREAGFHYAALDLEGYRTGSLNRELGQPGGPD